MTSCFVLAATFGSGNKKRSQKSHCALLTIQRIISSLLVVGLLYTDSILAFLKVPDQECWMPDTLSLYYFFIPFALYLIVWVVLHVRECSSRNLFVENQQTTRDIDVASSLCIKSRFCQTLLCSLYRHNYVYFTVDTSLRSNPAQSYRNVLLVDNFCNAVFAINDTYSRHFPLYDMVLHLVWI